MFGFLKNLLARLGPAQARDRDPPAPMLPPAPAPNPPAESQDNVTAPAEPQDNGTGVRLPVRAILSGLPLELQARVRQLEVGNQTVSVPLEAILPQLARGIVKIPFSALRQAAPQVFSSETDGDGVQVTLPLREILSRLDPALVLRRRAQRQVEVPEHISSPFDPQGHARIVSEGLSTPGMPPDSRALTAPNTPLRPAGLTSPEPPALLDQPLIPMPAPAPAPARLPPSPLAWASAPGRQRDLSRHPRPLPGLVAQPATSAKASDALVVSLVALAEGWPEAVRRDMVQLNLLEAKVALPAETVEQALKQGRVAFTWKTLRSWIRPAPPGAVSILDNAVVQVPLKVVAPLFLARQRETGQSRRKVSIDESIPNLFFGFPQPESSSGPAPGAPPAETSSAPAPAARAVESSSAPSSDSNYYVQDGATGSLRPGEPEVKRGFTAGTRFITKYATPNEIVSRAASLDNVAGALIGLPDGLLVASRLGPELNADTLAAFLPQIFGKVSQCTRELRMGELNNLNFTVGNVPWKIFRVNAIFFAAFGRASEPLPTAQLAAMAAELDHKPK